MAENTPPSPRLELIAHWLPHSVLARAGFKIVEISSQHARAQFSITTELLQPFGQLHGGVSTLMIESVASIAANARVSEHEMCVGIELNASHLSPAREGTVEVEAKLIRAGRRVQVWEVRLARADGEPICTGRCTMLVQHAVPKE